MTTVAVASPLPVAGRTDGEATGAQAAPSAVGRRRGGGGVALIDVRDAKR